MSLILWGLIIKIRGPKQRALVHIFYWQQEMNMVNFNLTYCIQLEQGEKVVGSLKLSISFLTA